MIRSSFTPIPRDRKTRFRLPVADQGESREVVYDAVAREVVKPAAADAKQ